MMHVSIVVGHSQEDGAFLHVHSNEIEWYSTEP